MMSTAAAPASTRRDPTRGDRLALALSRIGEPGALAAAALVTIAFLLLFYRWFLTQHRHSIEAIEDWGHAYAIPVISGFLIWRQRDELKRIAVRVFWPGLAVMLAGIAAYFFAVVGIKNHMLQGLSMILALFGLALLLLGVEPMKRLFLPIAYLVFGVTVSERIMIEITFRLQLIAAEGGWAILSMVAPLAGFTVDLKGNTLHLFPRGGAPIPLDVAEACSGMRMVIAFFALAGAVALVACRHWWQRFAVLLLAAPVAIFLNMIRVAVLGVLSLWDRDLATGDVHMLIGTLLLVPGLGLFMLAVWVLHRAVSDEPPRPARLPPVIGAPSPRGTWVAAVAVAVGVLTASAAGFKVGIDAANIYLRKLPIHPESGVLVRSIPTALPTWERVGTDRVESPDVEKALGTTNYVTRTYRRSRPLSPARIMDVHLAYYTGMVDTVPHVPDRCFVGAGIQIGPEGSRVVPVPLDRSGWSESGDPADPRRGRVWTVPMRNEFGARVGDVALPRDIDRLGLRVTQFIRPDDGLSMYAGYFFIANGAAVDSAGGVRLLAFDLESRYAYYLKVQFNGVTAASAEELAADAGDLLSELLPDLMKCVPDWVRVEKGLYPGPEGSGARKG
ncbi:MAG: exosortase/archaeosortase family protein [Phycisphaerae bacterium]|nr:exosortase/archaeosortase family protein [Phycisphaerae bacterium]